MLKSKINNMVLSKFIDFFKSFFSNYEELLKIILRGVITLIIGYIALRIIKYIIMKILKRGHLDNIVISFIMSLVTIILYIIYIFIVLASFNIPTTSLAAIVASSGVAVALALKDSLSSIANGIVILITKPFKEGDYVSIGGADGTVYSINIVTTVLITPDNKQITVPNNTVTASNIINYSKNETRRLDLLLNLSYDYDTIYIRELLETVVLSHASVQKAPQAMIKVGELNENFVVYYCRVWVKTSEFWPTKFDLLENILKVFKENNIEISHSQLDVTIKND